MPDYSILQEKLHTHFQNGQLLLTAFTHRSFLNESQNKGEEHNERMEFLGDAALEILVSEYLYKQFPDLREGVLTAYRSAVVKMESLAEVAKDLEFGEYIRMSKGEAMTGGRTRPYILANTFEAFLGALFLDQGLDACKRFLSLVFFDRINTIIQEKGYIDSKSHLQELAQEKFKQIPVYKLVKEEGPDHDKVFTVTVSIQDKILATGTGKSKQQAQQDAATVALQSLM